MRLNGWKTKRCQYRFLHLDLIDLDAEQLVLKFIVEIEPVSILNIFPTGVLVEDAGFSAGQGLQRTPELSVLCEGLEKKGSCKTGSATHRNPAIPIYRNVTYASSSVNLLHTEFLPLTEH